MTRTQYLEQVEQLRQTMITVELETKRRYPIGQRCIFTPLGGKPESITVRVESYIADHPEVLMVKPEFGRPETNEFYYVRDLIPIDEQGNEIP